MEQHHDGHESSPIKRRALGAIRATIDGALRELERGEPEETAKGETGGRRRRGPKGKLAAIAAAAFLDVLARRAAAASERRATRRRGPGAVKLAVLFAAGLGIVKLIAARR